MEIPDELIDQLLGEYTGPETPELAEAAVAGGADLLELGSRSRIRSRTGP